MIADRRAYFRKGLADPYLPYYDTLCTLLPDYFQPICGVRSFDEQADLYASGRDRSGPILTNAGPGLSFHNYGLASDWDYFDGVRYAPLPFHDPKWNEYLAACEKAGVRCIEWEKPHNEYPANVPISQILAAYNKSGLTVALTLLKGN